MKITATIITQDEERNIARAIESLRCCDEILIVDSGSTDRTVELAKNLGVRVLSFLDFWPFNHLGDISIVLARKPD